ncbi:PREDICTED: proteasome-associated protein ECM29 homolog [Priapulus caudatus]|uniref:Proteasome-associated protein ECM29 homolog n=1 Tax=Priapulus caudatus TaxID=37621 RepID=A0ABM1F909_PRICU|nr:PREDICTED: proteasome-associated protein ECM29 homolog [Priapulus caudatus]
MLKPSQSRAVHFSVLLERVFLRVGSAETDEQLQNVICKFLPPVLLKLGSQQDGVRKKVMELLVHINKRVKSRPKVQLPVEALLLQYQDPAASPFVTNFTIIYLKLGYPRMGIEKQAELASSLINCLDGKPQLHQDSLMFMLMPVLGSINVPADPSRRKSAFCFAEKPQTAKLLLDFMMDVLLLPYGTTSQVRPGSSAAQGGDSAPSPPPGMSEYALKRVTGDNPLSPEALEKAKTGIVKFLAAEFFSPEDIVCQLVVATSDTRHGVAGAADMELRKISGVIDWNKTEIIVKLYNLFRGTLLTKEQRVSVKPEHKRATANTRIKLKILPYLLKSREAANQLPYAIQVIFDCLYGANTNAKLKNMAVQFVYHLCISCSEAKLAPVGLVLLSGMIKLASETKEDNKLRGMAYIAVGKLCNKLPQLAVRDIAMVQTFFDCIPKEDNETKLALQEALSLIAPTFKGMTGPNVFLIEAMILQNIERAEPLARLMALNFANVVFPHNHIPSRYVLLLATGDSKEQVRTEAMKILHSTPGSSSGTITAKQQSPASCDDDSLFPAFADMAAFIQTRAESRQNGSSRYVMGNHTLPFNPGAFGQIVLYLRMCLAYNAGVLSDMESVSSMQGQSPALTTYVRRVLSEEAEGAGGRHDEGMGSNVIHIYLSLIQQLLPAAALYSVMWCLLEIVAVAADLLAPKFVDSLKAEQTWTEIRMCGGCYESVHSVLFFLLATASCATFTASRAEVNRNTSTDKTQEVQHGAMLALSFTLSRRLRNSTEEQQQSPPNYASTAVRAVAAFLSSTNAVLSVGACSAIGEIARNMPLPLPSGELETESKEMTKACIVNTLLKKMSSSQEPNSVKEKAMQTLANLCVADDTFPWKRHILEKLLSSPQPHQIDLNFACGDALVSAALGRKSAARRDMWVQSEKDFLKENLSEKGDDHVSWLLDQLLEKLGGKSNAITRQAACVWLLTLVSKAAEHEAVTARLIDIQTSFINMLADTDELTQDVASKGLGLVYERGGEEAKKQLVDLLLDTLMTGRRKKTEVTDNTKIFEPGTLGKAPGGSGSLTTYKELCSLASDLNQPDLVYKFMHLANHHAMWNSKKGAAFGFTVIATQARDQLEPHLPKIIPRLYRYQYDPNAKIQQAMTSVWNALVADSKKMVDLYMKDILQDLISNLTSSMWRIRESSCLALNDLLRGRPLDDVIPELPTLWQTLLRVRDDIKESVRNAADIVLRTLSKCCVKICDPNYGKVGGDAMRQLLPVLLSDGVGSSVAEIRSFSLQTLVKLSKNAGPLLKPHIAVLVAALLEALSELEPQMLNYLSLHAAQSQETLDKLDSQRVAVSKLSPMMETINMCVQYVDEGVLTELVPRLCDLIRTGVGLGTKVGCANLVISLCFHSPQDLTAHTGKLMKAMLHGLTDRNATIRKSYAQALGHLVKCARDASVGKLLTKLRSWYMEKEDESLRLAVAYTLQAISKNSPDVMRAYATQAVPLVYFAMHRKWDKTKGETDAEQSIWEDVWLESTPGTEGGIRLYIEELVEITQAGLESNSWPMKAQAASGIEMIANKMAGNLGAPHLGKLLTALIAGLASRTWDGKEALLKAVAAICTNCKHALSASVEGQPSVEELLAAVMRECRKDKLGYKLEAVRAAGIMVDELGEDRFTQLWELLLPSLRKDKSKNEDSDSDEEVSSKSSRVTMKLDFQSVSYEALGKAWPKQPATQDMWQEQFCELLVCELPNTTWKVQLSILRAMQSFISRLCVLESSENIEKHEQVVLKLVSQIVPPVCQSSGIAKYAAVRTESITVLEKLIAKLIAADRLAILPEPLSSLIDGALTAMATDNQPELKHRAAELRKSLTTSK